MPWTVSLLLSLVASLGQSGSRPSQLSYLALGDSYTVGESTPTPKSFPYQLEEQLRAQGFQLKPPTIIAKTGWTTDELMHGIKSTPGLKPDYNLVTLLIGVNNQFRGRPVDEYVTQFGELVDKAIHLANGDPRRLVVLSIPDWSVTPFAEGRNRTEISHQIDIFNKAAQSLCKRRKVRWVDITQISRKATNDRTLIADDGLHPSAAMYGQWVKKILPAVKSALDSHLHDRGHNISS